MSFVFFDTETTGLNLGFDQIIHFAAVRTDAALNEVERFEARSRLLPHVVPHPVALRTNGLHIDQLTDESLPSHYQMVRSIREKLLTWSPAIFVGYNSIRFDEEMLRHALFQTLHPTYLTSSHGNCRGDVLGLVMAAAAITPACIAVPMGPEGRASFRLEHLASANAIAHERAHDAMADVAATLDLCRCVSNRSPELWQRFVRFSKKATVADFVDSEEGFFLTEFFANEAYHLPVVCVGRDPEQPNARLCLRLDCDVDRFLTLSDDELRDQLARKPSPVRRFRINASPTLTPLYDAPAKMLNGYDLDVIATLASRIKNDPPFCARLVSVYVATRTPRQPSLHVEQRIYDGFPGPQDEHRMAEFHEASWSDALSIALTFDDDRLRAFGLRLIYFAARSILPEKMRLEIERALTDRLVNDDAGLFTLVTALSETQALLSCAFQEADMILSDYRSYLERRIERVMAFRAQQLTSTK